jgi:DNA-binding MarR family transcriptional regulator
VLNDICNTPERIELAELYHEAGSWAWPGRSGALNRAAYQALISVAWQFATYEPRASERDLAEHAAATRQGINSAIERLHELGLLDVVRLSDTRRGKLYRLLNPQFVAISHRFKAKAHTQAACSLADGMSTGLAEHWQSASGDVESEQAALCSAAYRWADEFTWDMAELWGAGALGRSAGLVYRYLSDAPASITQLATLTGKAWATVRAALERLAEHHLAERSGSLWVRGGADVVQVAEHFRAEMLAIRRRERHERERQAWHEISGE